MPHITDTMTTEDKGHAIAHAYRLRMRKHRSTEDEARTEAWLVKTCKAHGIEPAMVDDLLYGAIQYEVHNLPNW